MDSAEDSSNIVFGVSVEGTGNWYKKKKYRYLIVRFDVSNIFYLTMSTVKVDIIDGV